MGEQAGVAVIKGQENGDPAAVVYDAAAQAKAKLMSLSLIPPARLHTKSNLMQEIVKIKVILKEVLEESVDTFNTRKYRQKRICAGKRIQRSHESYRSYPYKI